MRYLLMNAIWPLRKIRGMNRTIHRIVEGLDPSPEKRYYVGLACDVAIHDPFPEYEG